MGLLEIFIAAFFSLLLSFIFYLLDTKGKIPESFSIFYDYSVEGDIAPLKEDSVPPEDNRESPVLSKTKEVDQNDENKISVTVEDCESPEGVKINICTEGNLTEEDIELRDILFNKYLKNNMFNRGRHNKDGQFIVPFESIIFLTKNYKPIVSEDGNIAISLRNNGAKSLILESLENKKEKELQNNNQKTTDILDKLSDPVPKNEGDIEIISSRSDKIEINSKHENTSVEEDTSLTEVNQETKLVVEQDDINEEKDNKNDDGFQEKEHPKDPTKVNFEKYTADENFDLGDGLSLGDLKDILNEGKEDDISYSDIESSNDEIDYSTLDLDDEEDNVFDSLLTTKDLEEKKNENLEVSDTDIEAEEETGAGEGNSLIKLENESEFETIKTRQDALLHYETIFIPSCLNIMDSGHMVGSAFDFSDVNQNIDENFKSAQLKILTNTLYLSGVGLLPDKKVVFSKYKLISAISMLLVENDILRSRIVKYLKTSKGERDLSEMLSFIIKNDNYFSGNSMKPFHMLTFKKDDNSLCKELVLQSSSSVLSDILGEDGLVIIKYPPKRLSLSNEVANSYC